MIHLNIKLTHVYLENMIMDIIDHLHQQVQGRGGGGIHRAILTFQMLQSYHSIVFHSYCPIVILFVHSEDIHEVLHTLCPPPLLEGSQPAWTNRINKIYNTFCPIMVCDYTYKLQMYFCQKYVLKIYLFNIIQMLISLEK